MLGRLGAMIIGACLLACPAGEPNIGPDATAGKADHPDSDSDGTPDAHDAGPRVDGEPSCTPATAATSLRFVSTALGEPTPGEFVSFLLQADLNDDDRPDLVASMGSSSPGGPVPMPWAADRLSIWLGAADGTFEPATEQRWPGLSHGALTDVDGDGAVDLVVVAHAEGGDALRVHCGQRTAPHFVEDGCGFSAIALPAGLRVRDLRLASVEGAEILAAVAGARADGTTEVLAVRWALTTHTVRPLSELLTPSERDWVALEFVAPGLIDAGGAADLVVTNGTAYTLDEPLPQVFVFAQAFDPGGAVEVSRLHYQVDAADFAKYAQPRRPIVADLDLDGSTDIAVVNYGVNDHFNTGMPALFFGDADGVWTFVGLPDSFGGEPIEGYVLDLDGNCLPDLVGMASDRQGIAPMLQTTKRAFVSMNTALSINGAHRDWLVHGDYDHDGRVDLVTATAAGTPMENPLPDRDRAPIVVHLQR